MQKPKKNKKDPKQFQEYLNSIEQSDCITTLTDVSEVYVATDNFTPDQAESLRRRNIFKFTDVSMISRVPENLQDQFEIEQTDALLSKFKPIDDPKQQPKMEKKPPKPKPPQTTRDKKRARIWNLYSQGVDPEKIKKLKIASPQLVNEVAQEYLDTGDLFLHDFRPEYPKKNEIKNFVQEFFDAEENFGSSVDDCIEYFNTINAESGQKLNRKNCTEALKSLKFIQLNLNQYIPRNEEEPEPEIFKEASRQLLNLLSSDNHVIFFDHTYLKLGKAPYKAWVSQRNKKFIDKTRDTRAPLLSMAIDKYGVQSYMISKDQGTSVEVNYFLADTLRAAQFRHEDSNIVIFGDQDPKHSKRIREMILGRNIGFVYNGARCKSLSNIFFDLTFLDPIEETFSKFHRLFRKFKEKKKQYPHFDSVRKAVEKITKFDINGYIRHSIKIAREQLSN